MRAGKDTSMSDLSGTATRSVCEASVNGEGMKHTVTLQLVLKARRKHQSAGLEAFQLKVIPDCVPGCQMPRAVTECRDHC
jgi:hypothetical protein